MDDISKLLAACAGDVPSDVLVTGGRVINVFNGEIESVDIAILGSRIAGIGGVSGKTNCGRKRIVHRSRIYRWHVHAESSLCTPAQFAAAVVPRRDDGGDRSTRDCECRRRRRRPLYGEKRKGPAAESGGDGAKLRAGDIHGQQRRAIGVDDLNELKEHGVIHGLAEVMNYPAVTGGDKEMLAKIAAMRGRPVDGHCPAVTGRLLNAYVAAGVGSDHEATTVEEAKEKLARGLYLLVREATNARNLAALLPMINRNSRRICFCTDDRTSRDLLEVGSIDEMVRRAIAAGIEQYAERVQEQGGLALQ